MIKDQQNIINQTLGLEIIGSDIITSDDIMIPFTPTKPNLKVSIINILKVQSGLRSNVEYEFVIDQFKIIIVCT